MAEERERVEWDRTSDLLALTANCHRGEKHRPFTRDDFHPFPSRGRPQHGVPLTKENIGLLKKVFVDQRKA